MKKILHFLSVLLAMTVSSSMMAQELDSLKREALSAKLDEYLAVIEREPVDVQKEECDFLIEAASDSLVRQFTALKLYDHYFSSPVMGAESVAIHILDNWFIPGTVSMGNDVDLLNAKVYAEFNRQSLIGSRAPQLTLKTPQGNTVSLFGDDGGLSDVADKSRFSVLYFYDTDCAKCRVQTILLRNILEDNDFPVDFYAVYAGDDSTAWSSYIEKQLSFDAPSVRVNHLWDPQLDSDFQRKYGVLQTPRMLLISPSGIILGRGLDAEALLVLLKNIFAEVELDYGSDESAGVFDQILGPAPAARDVRDISDYIRATTLQQGDTVMFRQLSGDLLYYLSSHTGEGVKEGLDYLIDNNISGVEKVWVSADDSLKVIGFAQIMDDLLSKARPGTVVPAVKVPVERVKAGSVKSGKGNLSRLKGKRNVIVFYTEGCEVCKAEKEAVVSMTAYDRKIRAYFINVDKIVSEQPETADRLFESFDLTTLPLIIETDRKGLILRRYVSYL